MGKRVKSVKALIDKISEGSQFKKKAEDVLERKQLAKFLFALRCKKGYTQAGLAKKIGCSQSRISKIESSFDEELNIKDFLDYAKALDLQFELGYRSQSVKTVDLIKYHAFKIKHYLEILTKLAQDDESMDEEIKKFHLETIFNVVKITLDSMSQLKSFQKEKKTGTKKPIHISVPLDSKGELTLSS